MQKENWIALVVVALAVLVTAWLLPVMSKKIIKLFKSDGQYKKKACTAVCIVILLTGLIWRIDLSITLVILVVIVMAIGSMLRSAIRKAKHLTDTKTWFKKKNGLSKGELSPAAGIIVIMLFTTFMWFTFSDGSTTRQESSNSVNRGQALIACEKEAKTRSNYPESVSFSSFLDAAWIDYPNGRTRLNTTFTAKNGFGAERKFNIDCLFTKSELIEATVKEAR